MTLEDLGGAASGVRAHRFVIQLAPFERRLRRRNPVLGEASEGAVAPCGRACEAPPSE
jgi:hypothetical protein